MCVPQNNMALNIKYFIKFHFSVYVSNYCQLMAEYHTCDHRRSGDLKKLQFKRLKKYIYIFSKLFSCYEMVRS